jgi:hypothetical protein
MYNSIQVALFDPAERGDISRGLVE